MDQESQASGRRGTNDVDRSPEAIYADMVETRSALAGKIEALENRVTSKVNAVKDRIETVKKSFDLPFQVRQHPWPMLGASVAVGFVLGALGRDRHGDAESTAGTMTAPIRNDGTVSSESSGGFIKRKMGMFGEEVDVLRQTAIGAVMALVKNALKTSFPGVAHQTDRVIDGITRKLGGEPVAGVFEPSAERTSGYRRAKAEEYGTSS